MLRYGHRLLLHDPALQKPPAQHGWPESPQLTQWSKSQLIPLAQKPL